MNCRMRIVLQILSTALVFGMVGCSAGDGGLSAGGKNSNETIISGGFIPNEITRIQEGGEFENESLAPHDSEKIPPVKLEGFWEFEGLVNGGEPANSDYIVTDKTIILNEQRVECLPKSIDIRPYSPLKALFLQGFGYGAADFQIVAEPDEYGITPILPVAFTPYESNGFVFATDGNTLALGFLDASSKIDEFGTMADEEGNPLDECTLTEVDYQVSFDGDRLMLTYNDISATYTQKGTPSLVYGMHSSAWNSEPLYEGHSPLQLLGRSLIDLLNRGYEIECAADELMPSRGVTEGFAIRTPAGTSLMAKSVNPYAKPVPIGYSRVCWYEYDDEGDGELTIGMPSTYEGYNLSQVFGETSYASVYNNYELPYECGKDYLCYKSGFDTSLIGISKVDFTGQGFDTGDLILESEHSSEIKLGFHDSVLSSISVSDMGYMTAGLQDNVAHDDLDELQPSVYREVAVRRDEILDELRKAFEDAGLDAAINESTGEVVMDNNVLFAKDSYELGDEGRQYLDGVFSAYASVVLDDRYSPSLKEISFEGNTDSDGDSEYNMRLSELRAQAVMEYCSGVLDDKQKDAFDGLATCRGYGESDLVYDERGNEDMDASRRVAIKFMLNVDDLKSEAGSQSGEKDASDEAHSSSSSSDSDDGPASSTTQGEADELTEFHSISGNFDQAWTLYEETESDGSIHASVLLLSDNHDCCAYLDLEQQASSDEANGYYTFGKTSVEELGKNNQAITVSHQSDKDRLNIVFNAWKRDDMVSISDPWGGVNNLTAFDDVESAISFFEDVIS